MLGTTNTAATTTTVRSAVNSAVLQLTNTNTTGGASARGLGITVPAGRAPIRVNLGAGKAKNLDADKLDGLDSTNFAQGSHSTVLNNRIGIASSDSPTVLLELARLGRLTAWCPDSASGSAYVYFENTTGEQVRLFSDESQLDAQYSVDTLEPSGRGRLTQGLCTNLQA